MDFHSSRSKFAINNEKKRKISEILKEEQNSHCMDCQSNNPEYISINNGIFICKNCFNRHKKYPKYISNPIKNNITSLSIKEIQYLYFGGNKRLIDYMKYEYPKLKKYSPFFIYKTYAMEYYRNWLKYLVEGGPKPTKPNIKKAYNSIINENYQNNYINVSRSEMENNNDADIITVDFFNDCYNYNDKFNRTITNFINKNKTINNFTQTSFFKKNNYATNTNKHNSKNDNFSSSNINFGNKIINEDNKYNTINNSNFEKSSSNKILKQFNTNSKIYVKPKQIFLKYFQGDTPINKKSSMYNLNEDNNVDINNININNNYFASDRKPGIKSFIKNKCYESPKNSNNNLEKNDKNKLNLLFAKTNRVSPMMVFKKKNLKNSFSINNNNNILSTNINANTYNYTNYTNYSCKNLFTNNTKKFFFPKIEHSEFQIIPNHSKNEDIYSDTERKKIIRVNKNSTINKNNSQNNIKIESYFSNMNRENSQIIKSIKSLLQSQKSRKNSFDFILLNDDEKNDDDKNNNSNKNYCYNKYNHNTNDINERKYETVIAKKREFTNRNSRREKLYKKIFYGPRKNSFDNEISNGIKEKNKGKKIVADVKDNKAIFIRNKYKKKI